jgi:hypothetical protein
MVCQKTLWIMVDYKLSNYKQQKQQIYGSMESDQTAQTLAITKYIKKWSLKFIAGFRHLIFLVQPKVKSLSLPSIIIYVYSK